MRGRARTTLAILALGAVVLTLGQGALGQVFLEPSTPEVKLEAGETSEFSVNFTNPTDRSYFVAGQPTGNLSASTKLVPARFPLAANGFAATNVTITPPDGTEFREGTLFLRFTIVDRQTGETLEKSVRLDMRIDSEDLLIGLFENPLPRPFRGGWGMFAAELVTWMVVAFVFVSVTGMIVHRMASRAREAIQDEMIAKVKAPIWYNIVVYGINFSWRLVPRSPLIDVIDAVLNAVAVLIAGVLAYRATQAGLIYYSENIAGRTETKVDDVLIPVLEKVTAALIVAVAAYYTFRVIGVDLSFLLAGGLVVGLVISMAAQDTLSNFFSGIFILVDRPFREGDELQLDTGEICRVEEIGLRSSRLYHFQNHQQFILPNNELATKRIINLSYPDRYYRLVIDVGVAYDSDLPKVIQVLLDVANNDEEIVKHGSREPVVFLKGFGDSSIDFQLRAFVPSSRHRNPMGTRLMVAVKKAFDENGIEIPFPQRVVWFHNADGKKVSLEDTGVGPRLARPKDLDAATIEIKGGAEAVPLPEDRPDAAYDQAPGAEKVPEPEPAEPAGDRDDGEADAHGEGNDEDEDEDEDATGR